jgi:integrator complex subunit 3
MSGGKRSISPPRLFVTSILEPKDDPIEARHDRCFKLVASITQDKGDKEGNEALAAAVSRSEKAHEDICVGLIVGILGDPEAAGKHYRDLTLVARDGLMASCNHLTSLVLEKYPKMYPAARTQLLWLTREMIKSSVANMENICWNLMRQIAGGDISLPNLWLADNLLDIFIDHRSWLERFPFLLASVVYTYLRIIEDHVQQHLEKLREKEVRFVVSLMREHFSEVCVIGRDLLRVLQYVAKIPEFEQLWMDIINQPKSLSPNFSGITSLMHTRTSRRFLQSRITPEMEKKLVFLTSQVSSCFQDTILSLNEIRSLLGSVWNA